MKQIIPFAHQLFIDTIQQGDVVVDATLGNGHDSLMLSQLVGENGRVYSFDIQQEAIDQSQQMFNDHLAKQITPILRGNEHVYEELTKRNVNEIDGAIFNLGFLPGSDQSITTNANTTIEAIEGILKLLKPERYIVIVIYSGHETGEIEKNELLEYLATKPAKEVDIAKYQMVNRSKKAPFVVAVYKK
ncbi:tRNA (mnm(5)s(2)U34)-methyltransferase [Alkalibacillus haloalkaliphilus]|uniref:tRNA (mnm(5)s(2)U34)-methyltransferase n=1 Tax=Alkalibacillus haloalkaliphilus TaxID=94136 RepID=UPI0002E39722|nr:class I SAM-dependent methyltransferase [Alkalibacillus haloalkaliphilus]